MEYLALADSIAWCLEWNWNLLIPCFRNFPNYILLFKNTSKADNAIRSFSCCI